MRVTLLQGIQGPWGVFRAGAVLSDDQIPEAVLSGLVQGGAASLVVSRAAPARAILPEPEVEVRAEEPESEPPPEPLARRRGRPPGRRR